MIERKKQGLGKPDIIYVKNFFLSSEESGSEVYNVNLCRSQNETSEGLDDGPQEVYKEDPNKNKNNNTEFNNNESNLILSGRCGKKRSDVAGYQQLIKENAEMVSVIFRHDGDDPEERKTEEFRNYAKVIHRLFDMAKFCPCEENGTVSYDEIKVWVDKLIRILDSNHQKEMFGYVLGRLFAYAPKAADGHYPCEAVCQIIEEYGDESLLSEYRCELFNKRGIFSPSAGRAEKDIAEDYKDNADFLSIKYPKTADVFFKMSQRYVYDSDLERRRAENGYF